MESLNPELSLNGSKNECGRTDTVYFPLSEVGTRAVTLSRTTSDLNKAFHS